MSASIDFKLFPFQFSMAQLADVDLMKIPNDWLRTEGRLLSEATSLKMGHPRPLFCLFSSFQTNITHFTTNICEKCPSSVRCWDSNPRTSEHESPHITTWPVFLYFVKFVYHLPTQIPFRSVGFHLLISTFRTYLYSINDPAKCFGGSDLV